MQWSVLGVFLIISLCLAEIEIPNHPNNLDDVPFVKKRCEEKGKTDTYERLKVAINDTRTCLQGKIDPSQIKSELEEAKKTGSMDEVFGKYCNKRQEYKDCIFKTVNITKECLEEAEITALDTAVRVIDEVAEFACYRDGDRLAMFVAEGGTECVSSRSEQIKNCLNATLKIDTNSLSLTSLPTSLPTLGIDKKKCDDLATIQQCVVNDLENNCKDTTPANIVDALFKFIKKTTCKNLKQKRSLGDLRIRRDIDFHALRMINSSAINQKFADECEKNGGQEASKEFWNAFFSTQTCLSKNRIFVTPKQDYLNNLKNCTKNNIEKIENCLSGEVKFYPKFMVKSLESIIEFAYDHWNLNQLTPKSDLVFCLQRIKSAGGIQKNIGSCTQGLAPQNQADVLNYVLPNKENLCKLWTDLDNCFNNFIRNTCAADIAVDRFLGNLTEAIQKPCKSD